MTAYNRTVLFFKGALVGNLVGNSVSYFFLMVLVHSMRILPLRVLRGIAGLLGWLLYYLVASRRRIGRTNLALCFPEKSEAWRKEVLKRHFVLFVQALFDRFWIWHSSPEVLRRRLRLVGDVNALQEKVPTVVFGPHFLGLDAAGMAVVLAFPHRDVAALYMPQRNKTFDAWMKAGRNRFHNSKAISRFDSPKTLVKSMRAGDVLYLLADMDFGSGESVFVPFFGVNTATLPSLGRFAQLGRAKVVTIYATFAPHGYDVHLREEWQDFPQGDPYADASTMNQVLEKHIRQYPAEYYWLHKRFKTRPEGEASLYD